jgi:hypothetical protein
MLCLDIYNEESECYTPYNFHDFCGFECRYNHMTESFDVNGFITSSIFIGTFEDESLAIEVVRSLYTIKATAETMNINEARFVDIDVIVDNILHHDTIEDDDEEEGDDILTEYCDEKIEEVAYCNVANKVICIILGIIIGLCGAMFL